jgi:hypothetical protein
VTAQLALPCQGRYLDAGADISPCGRYRYRLWRTWGRSLPVLVWCLHNPSTAGATAKSDDPTVKKMVGFSERWGYGGIVVVNLIPYRATNPRDLLAVDDLQGARGDVERFDALWRADAILAWGDVHRTHRVRAYGVARLAAGIAARVRCLGRTKSGQPRHPVRLAYATPLVPW